MSYGDEFYAEGAYGGLFGALTMDPGTPSTPEYPPPPTDRARIIYDNLALTSTITANSQVSDRPASYLKSAARWKKWRSATSTGDQWARFDFASHLVQGIALVDWRAHAGGTVKAEYWTGSTWADFATFTLPTFNPTRVVSVWVAGGVVTTRIRIYFTNTGAVSDYVELGVVLVGEYLEPSATLSDGFEMDLHDPSDRKSVV